MLNKNTNAIDCIITKKVEEDAFLLLLHYVNYNVSQMLIDLYSLFSSLLEFSIDRYR